ncbi:MAG: flippase [Armatimonadota bacterium]|nr:flippase [Armatimonadota bacterium]
MARAVAWNTGVQLAVRVVVTVTQALAVMILARAFVGQFGPEDGIREMGRYTVIFTFMVLLEAFSRFGFYPTLVKELSTAGGDAAGILARAVPIRLAVAGFVAVCGVVITLTLEFDSVVTVGVALAAVAVCWSAMSNTVMAYFQSRLLMGYPAVAELLGRLVGFAGVVAAALAGAPLLVIVGATIAGFFVTFVISLYFLRRFEPLGWQVDPQFWRTLVRQAAPVGLITGLAFLYLKTGTIMLGAIRGSFDVGIYGIPFRVMDVLVAVPAVFVANVFPVLARNLDDPARAQLVFRRSVDFLAVATFPIVAGVFVLAGPIIYLVGGQAYLTASTVALAGLPVTAVTVLQVLVWIAVAAASGNLMLTLAILRNLQGKIVWVVLVATMVNIGANYLLIPRYSYLGTSVATILTEIAVAGPGWYLVGKAAGFRPDWTVARRAGVAALVMGAVVWPVRGFPFEVALVVGVPLGMVVYAALLALMGVFPVDTVKDLLRKTPVAAA